MSKVKRLHNKLVRDKIPDYLEENDIEAEIEVVDDQVRFERLLLDQLAEEASEVGLSDESEILEELGDMESIIDAILKLKGFSREDLERQKEKKDAEKGVFEEKVFLISTLEEEEEVKDEEMEEEYGSD